MKKNQVNVILDEKDRKDLELIANKLKGSNSQVLRYALSELKTKMEVEKNGKS